MVKILEYKGKLILSYESRSEQLAICKLYDLLHVATIEDVVMILDGYDAKREAENDPKWSAASAPRELVKDFKRDCLLCQSNARHYVHG